MEKRTIERYKNLISIRISSGKPSFFEVNIKSPEISLPTMLINKTFLPYLRWKCSFVYLRRKNPLKASKLFKSKHENFMNYFKLRFDNRKTVCLNRDERDKRL